ncbi:hypothetical protein BGX38DRAFT_1153714 [Terfezia claveryi]|nr:hypothetical protein BGX38DRAFT_1153714 [Terfezia claveryi]
MTSGGVGCSGGYSGWLPTEFVVLRLLLPSFGCRVQDNLCQLPTPIARPFFSREMQ